MRRRFATRADTIIMAVLTALALAGLVIPLVHTEQRAHGSQVAIRVPDGVYTLDFGNGECRDVIIEGSGGTLTLELSGYAARVAHSDCPDQLCVRMGQIERRGDHIACLPLGVLITIAGDGEAEYDAIAR